MRCLAGDSTQRSKFSSSARASILLKQMMFQYFFSPLSGASTMYEMSVRPPSTVPSHQMGYSVMPMVPSLFSTYQSPFSASANMSSEMSPMAPRAIST